MKRLARPTCLCLQTSGLAPKATDDQTAGNSNTGHQDQGGPQLIELSEANETLPPSNPSGNQQAAGTGSPGNQNEGGPIDPNGANEPFSYLNAISAQLTGNFPVLGTLNGPPVGRGADLIHLNHTFAPPPIINPVSVLQTVTVAAASPTPKPKLQTIPAILTTATSRSPLSSTY
ncbi:hypothetical protein VTI74DRAFT_11638 [Chaetomium olivicolor]